MKRSFLLTAVVVTGLALLGNTDSPSEYKRNWPQWRGPLGTGAAPAGNPPVFWSESKNIKWKVRIPGSGSSTPIVWEDLIFIQTAIPTRKKVSPSQEESMKRRRRELMSRGRPRQMPITTYKFVLLAIDRETGKIRWERTVQEARPHEPIHSTNTWSSSSPVTDGEHVFAYFGSQGLYCFDLDGNLAWEKDFGDKRQLLGLGEGSSPALYKDKIVVQWDHEGQSFIIALETTSGRELWRQRRDERTSWATPLIVEHRGGAQVVTVGDKRIRAYDLNTGKLLWETGSRRDNFIPTPVAANGRVYLSGGIRRRGAYMAIRLDRAEGDITGTSAIEWTHRKDISYVPSPLLFKGALYFLKGDNGILSSVDVRDGKKNFGPVRLPDMWDVYASPVGVANRIYLAGREGRVVVLSHGSEFRILATNTLEDGFDASPAIVGDEIYLRGRKHLYRISRD